MGRWPQRLCAVSAIPLLGLGIVQVVYGTLVYNFTSNIKIGAWYVGILSVVTALLGFSVKFHPALSGAYPLVCILTATVALVGTLIDGIAYAIIGYLKACGNDGVNYWGESKYFDSVLTACELPSSTRDCYCVISTSSSCFSYDGNGKDTFDQGNCDPLLGEYPVSKL